jgi:hypothetical protein
MNLDEAAYVVDSLKAAMAQISSKRRWASA